ncbi:ML domain-containing protein [Sergentomyia squamirostris]
MWRFLILGALASIAFAVNLEKCRFGAKPLDLRSPTCNDTHCFISASAPTGFEVDLKVPKKTVLVFPSVVLHLPLENNRKAEYPVEIHIKRGCKYLVSHSCPLKTGDIITWSFDWDFLSADVIKVGSTFKAEIILHDEYQDPMVCVKVNTIVVK